MSIAACVADFLSGDITDSDPNTVLAANSDYDWTLLNLPEFTYKSLGTLWVGPSTTQAQLLKRYSVGVWRRQNRRRRRNNSIDLSYRECKYTRTIDV